MMVPSCRSQSAIEASLVEVLDRYHSFSNLPNPMVYQDSRAADGKVVLIAVSLDFKPKSFKSFVGSGNSYSADVVAIADCRSVSFESLGISTLPEFSRRLQRGDLPASLPVHLWYTRDFELRRLAYEPDLERIVRSHIHPRYGKAVVADSPQSLLIAEGKFQELLLAR